MEPIKKGKVTKADLQLALNSMELQLDVEQSNGKYLLRELEKSRLAYDALLNYTVDK